MKRFLLTIMFLLLFSGCGSNNINNHPTKFDDNVFVINQFEQLKIDYSEEDTILLFGNSYTEYKNSAGEKEWRFDFGAADNYKFPNQTSHEGKADISSIELGKISSQIFITWDNQGVYYASMFYKNGQDHKIHILELRQSGDLIEHIE